MNRGNPFKQRRYLREQEGCPFPVDPCEESGCEERREILATGIHLYVQPGDEYLFEYYFVNELSGYSRCKMCTRLAGFSLATVEQIALAAGDFNVITPFVCPMLMWADLNGRPVLVWVDPSPSGQDPIVEIVDYNPSLKCLAYRLCTRELIP